MKRMNWPAAILLAAMAVLVGYQTQASRSAAPGPAVIATVNIELLFEKLEERAAADTRLTEMAKGLDDEAAEKRKTIEEFREEMDMFPPGSEAHREAQAQWTLKSYELQAFLDFAVRKIDVEKSKTLRSIYDKMNTTMAAMALENGYDIVFVDDSIVELPQAATESEMMRQISARRMLYSSPQIDITNDVIVRMNNEFSAP